MNKYYYLDLFSGIGGFALGAYWPGMRFHDHFYSEIEPYPKKVYQLRFPQSKPLGDIRNVKASDLPQGEWIITGGFPCQDISTAGKGAGLAGERSGLWFEYLRLIGEIRPRFAIMENVATLTIRGLDTVLGGLAEIGYDAQWQDIWAQDVGAPHRRERQWIIAYPKCNKLQRRQIKAKDQEWQRMSKKQLPRLLQSSFKDEVSIARVWRENNGISKRLDGIRNKAIGNAIVPHIAAMIFECIKPYYYDESYSNP